jgi:hypothetical protein
MAYTFESELEALPELEDEFEEEYEDESEDEGESEEFLGGLLGEGEEFLGSILGESEDFLGGLLGESEDFLGSILGESEDEAESEDEYEDEASPIRRIYPDAVMEHLGELAAEAESEDEAAEHFLPLIGMAASKLLPVVARAAAPAAKRLLPKIAKVLTRATPRLTKGVGAVAKALHRHPQTRHLVRTVPGIARRTVGNLAHKAARGVRITPHTAVRTLASQARRVLGTPQHRAAALRRHNHLERKFHQRIGRGVARPHLRYGHGRHQGLQQRRYGVRGPGYAGVPRKASGAYRYGTAPHAAGRPRIGGAGGGHGGCCCGCCGRH